jgi:hypothetical protein
MYFPKSQIKTGLHTNGSEYVLINTLQEYIGYYFETSTGKKYTGKSPNKFSIELIPYNSQFGITGPITPSPALQTNTFIPETILTPLSDFTNKAYKNFVKDKPRAIPQSGLTYPTEEEKKRGLFTRYFCKKNNEHRYIEIIKPTYDRLINKNTNIAWDLYTAASLRWAIKGNPDLIYSFNNSSVTDIEREFNFLGFSQYFKGKFLQYYVEE